MKKRGILFGVLGNHCPYCDQGRVFNGFIRLNRRCPACDRSFLKEEGYYLGSMIAAYFFSCFTVIPVFVIGFFFLKMEIFSLILAGSVQVIILSPVVYRYSTLLWLWVETVFQQKIGSDDS